MVWEARQLLGCGNLIERRVQGSANSENSSIDSKGPFRGEILAILAAVQYDKYHICQSPCAQVHLPPMNGPAGRTRFVK